MPTSLTNDELAVLAASTLAETPFLAPGSPDEQAVQTNWVWAVVPFEADVKGRLVVAVPGVLAARVAADRTTDYGAADMSETKGGSAVAELARTVAGAIVTRLARASTRLRLGTPRVTVIEPKVARGERSTRVTLLNEADEPIHVELVLSEAS